MQTVKAFVYPNLVEVQLPDPTIFSVRKRVVYSRPITIYQGIDNPIQLIIKNQDNKEYDLTGYTVRADIQDPAYKVTIESFPVVFSDITKGQGTFTIDNTTASSLDQRVYKLTLRRIELATNNESPMYINDNYGVPLDLVVKPAYYSITEPAPQVDETIVDGGIIE
jgi:hypothetical protein